MLFSFHVIVCKIARNVTKTYFYFHIQDFSVVDPHPVGPIPDNHSGSETESDLLDIKIGIIFVNLDLKCINNFRKLGFKVFKQFHFDFIEKSCWTPVMDT
jgi:hypothetical protein